MRHLEASRRNKRGITGPQKGRRKIKFFSFKLSIFFYALGNFHGVIILFVCLLLQVNENPVDTTANNDQMLLNFAQHEKNAVVRKCAGRLSRTENSLCGAQQKKE